jgi:hypothetical protein
VPEPPDPSRAGLPGCGLYRTTTPLPGHADAVPAEHLVYFHDHSDAGPPLLLLPAANVHNRWRFHERGHLVTDPTYPASLAPLLPEGFYRLREHFHPSEDQVVNQNALVQLGYNRAAQPILFFPVLGEHDNSLVFPSRGTRIGPTIYALLEPLDHRGPYIPGVEHLH